MDSGGSGLAVWCVACPSLVPPGISGRYQFGAIYGVRRQTLSAA